MTCLSLALLVVFLGGAVLSAPSSEPDWSIGETFETDICKDLESERNDPTLGKIATKGSKLLCGRSDKDFVDKVLHCGEDDTKSTKSFISCINHLAGKGADAPCSDWGKYFKCGMNEMGTLCGGKDANKILAYTIDYAYTSNPKEYPAIFQKCSKEIIADMQSIYA